MCHKIFTLSVFFFMLIIGGAGLCFADDSCFVDPTNGDDGGTGTFADPFKSLAAAWNHTFPTWTGTYYIYVMPGRDTATAADAAVGIVFDGKTVGTSKNIVIQAYDMDNRPTIAMKGIDAVDGAFTFRVAQDRLTFKGLIIESYINPETANGYGSTFYLTGCKNINIVQCKIVPMRSDADSTQVGYGTGSSIMLEDGVENINIFNNVFVTLPGYQDFKGVFFIAAGEGTSSIENVLVRNNTIIILDDGGILQTADEIVGIRGWGTNAATVFTKVRFINNVWHSESQHKIAGRYTWDTDNADPCVPTEGVIAFNVWSNMLSTMGNIVEAETLSLNNFTGDPLMVRNAGDSLDIYSPECGMGQVDLVSDPTVISTMINGGTDTDAPDSAKYLFDYLGNAQPFDNYWDIGAFECQQVTGAWVPPPGASSILPQGLVVTSPLNRFNNSSLVYDAFGRKLSSIRTINSLITFYAADGNKKAQKHLLLK